MIQNGLEIKLRELGKIISDKMGIDFVDHRLPDLRRGIERAAKELGHRDWVSCLQWLLTTPISRDTIKVLAAYLTIGETYFFRDEKLFKAIEQRILPDIMHEAMRTNKVIRIWCAGCSTGEEPYSLAIILSTVLGDLSKWNVTILATDINTSSLRRATEGVYTEWSFRGTPDWWKTRYFAKVREGRYHLINDIKKLVTFSYHNLVEDPFPSLTNNTNAMHIILCRNVLMYFNPTVRRQVVHRFHASLVDRGWLIASPAETALIEHPSLKRVTVFGTLAHQKGSGPVLHHEYVCPPHSASTVNSLAVETSSETNIGATSQARISIYKGIPDRQASETAKPELATSTRGLAFEEAQRLYLEGRHEELLNRTLSRERTTSWLDIDDARILALLSRAFANTGSLNEAVQWCGEAIKKDRTNPSYHFLLATILQELGVYEGAVKALKTAIYLDQDFIPAHFALANLEKKHGNPDRSRRHFRNILKLLERFDENGPFPESEGMTAGRMREIVRSVLEES